MLGIFLALAVAYQDSATVTATWDSVPGASGYEWSAGSDNYTWQLAGTVPAPTATFTRVRPMQVPDSAHFCVFPTDTVRPSPAAVCTNFVIPALPPDTLAPVANLQVDVALDTAPPADTTGWPNNEPAGLVRIMFTDGSDKFFPDSAGSAFFGSRWTSDTDSPVVDDPASKHGKAIEVRTYAGDVTGWHGMFSSTKWTAGDMSALYLRLVYRFSPNWQTQSSGDKWFYFGTANTDPPTQYYLLHRASQIRFTKQGGGGANQYYTADYVVTLGTYHTLEVYIVGQSAQDAADGELFVWHDGQQIIHVSGKKWTEGVSNTNFEGMQGFLYWGGSSGTKAVNDNIRISEFYVSGR